MARQSCWWRGLLLLVLLVSAGFEEGNCQLKISFYRRTCPRAESIVHDAVSFAIFKDPSIAGSILRMHFHDCFTQGCDGSILLDSVKGQAAEKDAPPNRSLRGFDVIDVAKSRVEAVCLSVVSCADILAFAARDSVVQMGGISWSVPSGRRDGFTSIANDANTNLPSFSSTVAQLTQIFQAKGLTPSEMVTLSGAHTFGSAACSSFIDRLYRFNSTLPLDPGIDPQYAQTLMAACPRDGASTSANINLDVTTPNVFDNAYFQNLMSGKGLLQSDQLLGSDSKTKGNVRQLAGSNTVFLSKFGKAMVKMGNVGVKTGTDGEIRRNCRVVNS